jgi:hypothetical protein
LSAIVLFWAFEINPRSDIHGPGQHSIAQGRNMGPAVTITQNSQG